MTKSTTFFLVCLMLLALLLGYGKYVLLPKYQAQQTANLAVLSPTPSASLNPVASPAPSAAHSRVNQLMTQLTDRQKLAQLFAVSLSSVSATRSALASKYFVIEPGFVQFASPATPSGQQLNTFTSTPSAMLSIFDLRPAISASLSAVTATSAANLSKQVINSWQNGAVVVILSRVIQPPQFISLLTEMTVRYQQDPAFKQLIDRKLLEVLNFKVAYH